MPSSPTRIPLLVPLALLAALEVDSLKRGFSGALDWFGILTFGLVALMAWGILDRLVPATACRRASRSSSATPKSGFQPSFHLGAMLAAVGLTVLWIMLVRPARRSNRRAILNWAAGVTLIWGLATTIWLPYLDSRRSYRWTRRECRDAPAAASGCVASRNLGEPQRALFNYFSGIHTVREEVQPKHECDGAARPIRAAVRAAADRRRAGRRYGAAHRRGDDTERFVLYTRKP